MSPSERLFWLRVQRRVATVEPQIARALLKAIETLRGQLSETQLARLIRTMSPERLVATVWDEQVMAGAMQPVQTATARAVAQAGQAFSADIPRTVGGFNVLHPAVRDGLDRLDSRVFQPFVQDVREAIRQRVSVGLEAGEGPASIARDLRRSVGLAPNQEQAVRNFRRALEGDGDPFAYKLRDKRFDATVRRLRASGGLSEARMDTMTDAYRKRMLAFHANTVARTASQDAVKLGQRLAWDQAVRRGDVDGTRLFKRWAGVLDARERPEHVAMEKETVPYTDAFSNGEVVPGESTYNCRCIAVYTLVSNPATGSRPGVGTRAA